MPREKTTTIGRYLIHRLEEIGLRHVFGVPGDYVLSFFDLLVESRLKLVETCAELGAGYATDVYARVNGVGGLCITYCVGGLSAINAVAGAYAEKSPVIVISGSPGLSERTRSPLLHHQVKDFQTQLRIYEKCTAAAVALEDPEQAPRQIDQTIQACLWHKRPVYIEIPRDMVNVACPAPRPLQPHLPRSDKAPLAEAAFEAAQMLREARRPVILGGVEIHRYGLQKEMLKLIDHTGFPFTTTLLGKSIVTERHPQFVGVYHGVMSAEAARRTVEEADCLMILGAFLTDLALGVYTARLDESRTIRANFDRISIKHHHFEHVYLPDFIRALASARLGGRRRNGKLRPEPRPFKARPDRPVTVKRLFEKINHYLEDADIVVCDVGDSLFGAADLTIHRGTEFIGPAFYTSMGISIPGATGAQIGRRDLRPIVIVGDGAFQMTANELSTVVRYGLNPIILLINNKGYTTERVIHEGPYNDVHLWDYHKLPDVLRGGWGCEVRTEGELEDGLKFARGNSEGFSLLNIHTDPMDCSEGLVRLGQRLGMRVR